MKKEEIQKAKEDFISWNTVKEKYLDFHKMDAFTENMAIDIDFGYWLVNRVIEERIPSEKSMIAFANFFYKRKLEMQRGGYPMRPDELLEEFNLRNRITGKQ